MKGHLPEIQTDPVPRSLLLGSAEVPPRRASASPIGRVEPSPAEIAEFVPLNMKELERRCMGRVEFAERLLVSFEQRFPIEAVEITESLERADAAGLARLVHQLKGTTANIGAVALNRLLQRIEQVVQKGDLADLPRWLDRLDQEWKRFVTFRRSLTKAGSE